MLPTRGTTFAVFSEWPATMSDMPIIVGIGHAARVGKDTAAEALCRDLGFVRRGFADQLKAVAFECDPLVTPAVRTINTNIGHGRLAWVVQSLGGWEQAKDLYPEVRLFLQNLGAGCRNVFGDDFWVDQLMMWVKSTGPTKVVIPDVRYRNEAERIRADGGILIRINRPGFEPRGHVSETDLSGFDWDEEFDNNRGIVDLQATVVAYVRSRLSDRPSKANRARTAFVAGEMDPRSPEALVNRMEIDRVAG